MSGTDVAAERELTECGVCQEQRSCRRPPVNCTEHPGRIAARFMSWSQATETDPPGHHRPLTTATSHRTDPSRSRAPR